MPITKHSLISRRNFTLAGAHDSALMNMLTLGTSPFMYNNNNVQKMGTMGNLIACSSQRHL